MGRSSASLHALIAAALVAGLAITGVVGGATAQPAAQTAASQKRAFAHVGSDALYDTSVVFGVLPNGMRYAIKKNALPPGYVSMRFHINAGAAHEASDQLGLAHFLEHMAFNGSKQLKEDELMKTMERLGAQMGADTNAYTAQRETVYMFNLPSVDEGKIDTALMIYREIASELLIDPAAVDRERGVVLSEERGRASPPMRAAEANLAAMYPGHSMGRSPIGNTEILRTAPASRIRAFYDAYYRPERATLVIVGDFDPAIIETKIKARFSDWQGRGADGKDPPPLDLATISASSKLYTETGLTPQVALTWFQPAANPKDSMAASRQRTLDSFSTLILSRRFSDFVLAGGAPFLSGVAGAGETRDFVRTTSVSAAGATDLKATVEALVKVQRQAVEFGYRQDELDRVIANTRATLGAQAAAAPTRRTPAIVDSMLSAIVNEQTVKTPQQTLEMFETSLKTITLADLNANLKARFGGKGPYLFAADGKPFEGGDQAFATAFNAARTAPITAVAAAEAKPWPYTDFGPPGAIRERREAPEIGATFVTFANGVRLTVKKTDFTRNQIMVSARFGNGQLDLPRDKVSPVMLWSSAYTAGGLNKLTVVERNRATTGKQVGVSAGVGAEFFQLSGTTRPQDFEMQMQMLAAQISDAAWNPTTFKQAMDANALALSNLDTQPGAVFSFQAPLLLHSNDQRFAPPSPELYRSADVAAIKAFMAPIIAESEMEVIIVGDIAVDEAIAQTAKTLGNLPARKARPVPAGARDVRFAVATPEPVKLFHRGRADQGIAAQVWPATGYWKDPELADQLAVVMAILIDRVNEEMREKQGKSYGVGGGAGLSRSFPDYGELMVQTEISADVMPLFFETVDRVAKDLAANEVTQDEFDRAIRPRREALTRSVITNAYWMGALQGVQTDERRLAEIRRYPQLYGKVTPASVKATAQRWLAGDKAWKVTVTPQPAPVAAAAN